MITRMWTLSVMASLGLFGAGAVFAQDPEGAVRIEVVSAETRRPLEGVTVIVTPREGAAVTAMTTAEGILEVGALAEGLYAVTATRSGLVEATEPSVRVVRRKVTPLRLEMRSLAGSAPDAAALEEVIVRARARGREADLNGSASASFFDREELRSAVGAGSDAMADGSRSLRRTRSRARSSRRAAGARRMAAAPVRC
jgi:hypothetical protein